MTFVTHGGAWKQLLNNGTEQEKKIRLHFCFYYYVLQPDDAINIHHNERAFSGSLDIAKAKAKKRKKGKSVCNTKREMIHLQKSE